LQGLAALVLVSIGLYLAGWFPRFAGIEAMGAPLWKRLEPLGRRLLPVRSPAAALVFGAIWGWLPCGLVYSALLWTTTTGGGANGALTMLAFGAGTLPGVMSAGVFTGWLARVTRLPYVRQGLGVLLIVMAVISLWLAANAPADHSAHLLHSQQGQQDQQHQQHQQQLQHRHRQQQPSQTAQRQPPTIEATCHQSAA